MSREELEAAFGAAVRAYQTGVDNFDQAMADHIGINRTDARCIDLIDQAGGMTAGELAKAAHLTTGAVTAVIDRLEKAGLARRVADPHDRRRVRIEATDRVWEVTQPLIGPMVAESQAIIDDLSDHELARFTEFMHRAMEIQARHTERVRRL
ncbi:MAG TPA: MarR family transcriptional regulator [Solirubrobacteraceae bacterium]|nr:MarR family transcriptional regulator [Solirubrobacteraceae bacterium]